ncbi:hypothetical protein E4U27_007923, partial [Claviceps purpurea]
MDGYEMHDDYDSSDGSASAYTSDEPWSDDASDFQEDISSEGEMDFLPQTRR